ncbi:ion channel [Candidatus Haliotispira prima]|uniref:Ion channel n=1 Tax=Candidatus Haliotispira prima TaxID=3034016 RepID=A0ABY8MHB3_9SPIO|nr:ion channel [Candidatus Haliotispira prima]
MLQLFWFINHLLSRRRMMGLRMLLLLLLLNVLFGSLFYWAEKTSQPELDWFDALWWAVVTMTTVGYGDISPQSWAGRFLVAYPAMFVGIGLVSYVIGSLAVGVINLRRKQRMGMLKMKWKNHIVICNPPGVRKIANIIAEIRREQNYAKLPIVLLGDNWSELPEELKEQHIYFVHADPSRKSGLEQAGVPTASAVFILPGRPDEPQSDHSSFITASLVQALNRENREQATRKTCGRIRCLVELVLPENVALVQETQPDRIFVPQVFNEHLMVQEFLKPGIADLLGNLVSTEGDQIFVMEQGLAGWSLKDIYLQLFECGSNIHFCGIRKAGGEFDLAPLYTYVLQPDDKLLLLTREAGIYLKFEQLLLSKK